MSLTFRSAIVSSQELVETPAMREELIRRERQWLGSISDGHRDHLKHRASTHQKSKLQQVDGERETTRAGVATVPGVPGGAEDPEGETELSGRMATPREQERHEASSGTQ